jgi:hypothetical protein
MNTKEVQALESYFKTENEHWNKHAFEMLCEVLQQGNFENPETPLQLFDKAVNIFTEQNETPLKAIQEFTTVTDKANLNTAQRLFVYEWVYKYLRQTEFEGLDLTEVKDLLKSQTERLKAEKPKVEYNKPLTRNIRDTLKELMQKELEQLPETLKELDPVQRLNILCKLMPYVLPKTESVKHTLGEPDEFKIKRFHD